jgi:DNA-binding PadR family transcriptional regulator
VSKKGNATHDREGRPELPITSWAVLGMLSFGQPLTGYDVKKWADSLISLFYWSPAVSQVYSELRRLEEYHLASSELVGENEIRPRRLYRITPRGEAALTEWIATAPVEPPVLKHTVALRIWLGHLADPARLQQILLEHEERSHQMALTASRSRRRAADDAAYIFPSVVAQWAEQYYLAEERHALELLGNIQRMQEPRSRHLPPKDLDPRPFDKHNQPSGPVKK